MSYDFFGLDSVTGDPRAGLVASGVRGTLACLWVLYTCARVVSWATSPGARNCQSQPGTSRTNAWDALKDSSSPLAFGALLSLILLSLAACGCVIAVPCYHAHVASLEQALEVKKLEAKEFEEAVRQGYEQHRHTGDPDRVMWKKAGSPQPAQ
jgi:hypothetical protein